MRLFLVREHSADSSVTTLEGPFCYNYEPQKQGVENNLWRHQPGHLYYVVAIIKLTFGQAVRKRCCRAMSQVSCNVKRTMLSIWVAVKTSRADFRGSRNPAPVICPHFEMSNDSRESFEGPLSSACRCAYLEKYKGWMLFFQSQSIIYLRSRLSYSHIEHKATHNLMSFRRGREGTRTRGD